MMRKAFDILAEQYWPMLFTYIRVLVRREHVAEDLVQETLLTAYREIGRFRKGGNFGAWLRGIARKKVMESRRASARKRLVIDSRIVEGMEEVYKVLDTPHAEAATWRERLNTVNRCIKTLSEKLRAVVDHVYQQGKSLREAAESLDATFEAVAQRLSRARVLVRKCVSARLSGGGRP